VSDPLAAINVNVSGTDYPATNNGDGTWTLADDSIAALLEGTYNVTVTATDAQLIEQLKMTGEMIAACYHVPGYKIGVGQMPTVNNTAALNQQYYDQCLQFLVEKMEARLDEGLELEPPFEVWLDLTGLLRMDPEARYKSHNEAIKGGWKSPNEARREEDMEPVAGGDTPYMQQQNYSLAALAERDSQNKEGDATGEVASLQSILEATAAGKLPLDTARATIAATFPLLSTEQIEAMIKPIEDFEPPAPPTPPEPEEPEDEEPEPEEPEDEEPEPEPEEPGEEAAALVEYLSKAFDSMEIAA